MDHGDLRALMGDRRGVGSAVAVGARGAGREFPHLGSGTCRATPATRAKYFVTSPFIGMAIKDASDVRGEWLHAKAMGTVMTVCGMNTTSWPKLWAVPFSPSADTACPSCARLLGQCSDAATPP